MKGAIIWSTHLFLQPAGQIRLVSGGIVPSSEMKALNRISSPFELFQQNRSPLQVKQEPTSLKGALLSRSGMKNLRV